MSPANPPNSLPTNAFFAAESKLDDVAQKLESKIAETEASGAMAQMPQYQCHKKVWALKILNVVDPTKPGDETDGSRIIIPQDEGFAPFKVDNEYVRKHKPEAGGYYVVYADGYKSYSPANAFEEGYARL